MRELLEAAAMSLRDLRDLMLIESRSVEDLHLIEIMMTAGNAREWAECIQILDDLVTTHLTEAD